MCKYILLILILILIALMAVAAVVVQEYGWVGFAVFLGVLVLFGYVIRKAIPRLFMHMATRPLRRMGAALHGARIVVHSVEPCDPPPSEEYYPGDDPEGIEDELEPEGEWDQAVNDKDEVNDEEHAEVPAGPFDWYQIEFSVIPPGEESSEGRIVSRPGWRPQMIGAVGPRPRLGSTSPFRGWPSPGQFRDSVLSLPPQVWTGSGYLDLSETVFGEQRLRMRVGVTRAVRSVTITYVQFTDLGEVQLPRIDLTGADG